MSDWHPSSGAVATWWVCLALMGLWLIWYVRVLFGTDDSKKGYGMLPGMILLIILMLDSKAVGF